MTTKEKNAGTETGMKRTGIEIGRTETGIKRTGIVIKRTGIERIKRTGTEIRTGSVERTGIDMKRTERKNFVAIETKR